MCSGARSRRNSRQRACGLAVMLVCGRDFFLGYSPERMNPGDKEHTVERITKVIAGQTPEVVEVLRRVYGAIKGHMGRGQPTTGWSRTPQSGFRSSIFHKREAIVVLRRVERPPGSFELACRSGSPSV